MLASDCIVIYLANLMWSEQESDSFAGMTGCGLVVRNRILAGWESQDWVSLIQNHYKYHANPSEQKMWQLGDPIRNDRFRRCLAIASNIYEGREKDITFGATRYADLNTCSEDFANKIVRPTKTLENGCVELIHNRVAQIGKRTYFK